MTREIAKARRGNQDIKNPFLIRGYVEEMQSDQIDTICENFEKLYYAIAPYVTAELSPAKLLRASLVSANSLECWPESLD